MPPPHFLRSDSGFGERIAVSGFWERIERMAQRAGFSACGQGGRWSPLLTAVGELNE